MGSDRIKRFFISWVVFCALLSIYGYLGDLILNYEYALNNLNFLPAYFLLHLVFQSYIIGPVFFFIMFYLIK